MRSCRLLLLALGVAVISSGCTFFTDQQGGILLLLNGSVLYTDPSGRKNPALPTVREDGFLPHFSW